MGDQPEWTENERGLVIGDQVIALSHDKVKLILEGHKAALGALHHMEVCRSLLNVPNDEVLYQAIQELQRHREGLQQQLHRSELAAKDNSDWFDALCDELRTILGLPRDSDEVSPIIEKVKALVNAQTKWFDDPRHGL